MLSEQGFQTAFAFSVIIRGCTGAGFKPASSFPIFLSLIGFKRVFYVQQTYTPPR
ncbi:predicted protein [Neisseria gonorrhoeae SK-93-1035]|uniref:Uncharacterized protein n=1 Tax=Neisseria gonorrhoeae (strain NCCP11945) TaxID=521006 RepID=B4RRB1_NEIG2|nr:Hypothetical protein NGK_2569 [Neisseria gonorrhoeae NCCP11945]EEZ56056.1 predicted protein [Neisseria gonorrhoeae SK-92-679]EEZ58365.1 predicted protein [Neisseria gonorrhoeae SK-93-1035]